MSFSCCIKKQKKMCKGLEVDTLNIRAQRLNVPATSKVRTPKLALYVEEKREIIEMAKVVLMAVLLLFWVQFSSVPCLAEFTREDFPSDFVFGAGTSSFQYEGASAEDGKSPSIWDTLTHEGQHGGYTLDVASDGYHKYKGDIKLMSDTGLEAYRFSISWPRLLPNGRGPVNPKGLEYYNNFIDELIKNGIQPHVTLHHLDVPQVLQDEYGGWLSPKIIDDFKELANLCFEKFGDRVSHWTTINEPNINSLASFDYGIFPPRRCSPPSGADCTGGNSTVEPYIAAHNYILAHSAVAELYRKKYQAIQKGQIGINIYAIWFTPLTNSTEDALATKRALDFMLGWILNPIMFGDYPESMRRNAGSRLPSFTYSESQNVKGSCDFIGINYYVALYVADDPTNSNTSLRDSSSDMLARFTAFKNVTPETRINPHSPMVSDFEGLWNLLNYLKITYRNSPIYVHENGYGLGVVDTMNDVGRAYFLGGFIGSILHSIRDGVDVRGYFIWTFVDAYELFSGSISRFGLYHVNFEDSEYERTPKLSAYWYRNFLKNGTGIKIENRGEHCEETHPSQ